jgi:hypothetical protein
MPRQCLDRELNALNGAMPVIDHNMFRSAMSRLGAAVNLITSDGPAGR